MGQRIPVTLGNIAPLSLRPFQPRRIALVCEGGGQRGIFTAGVLDEFMRAQFNPFDLYLGTSAGRRTSRRLSAISPVTRAKSSCAIPQNANFSIHCALSVEEILSISTGWWRPPQARCRCKWIPPRGCLTAANRFICAPVVRMTTRLITFYQPNKTGWM